MSLPLLKLCGPAWDQGLKHGRQLNRLISENLATYFRRFKMESLLTREQVLERAERFAPEIEALNPDYYAGMEGIATGSGYPLIDIIALNVRYEIIYFQSMVNSLIPTRDGCTSFAISPALTENRHLIMGQNWDWIPGVKGALLHTEESDGLRTLSFTEAGIFGGKIGFNSEGLGLAVNGLSSTADDWRRLGKPFHVRCYEVLRSHDLKSAVHALTATRRAFSANFLLGQTPDLAIDVEIAPDASNPLHWQEGVLVHSNHFLEPEKIGVVEPPNDRRESTCHRRARLTDLLASKRPVTIDDVKGYLRDHTQAPGSICRHEDSVAPIKDQYRTVTSVVMDLQQQSMEITDGPPCQNSFEHFALA